MKNLTKQLLYKGDNVARANVVWNIAGSFVYAFASMVLSFLVIRMAGEEKGGIFSFGYSTLGQQLFLVAYFGIRPFQITDGKGEYSFNEYRDYRSRSRWKNGKRCLVVTGDRNCTAAWQGKGRMVLGKI